MSAVLVPKTNTFAGTRLGAPPAAAGRMATARSTSTATAWNARMPFPPLCGQAWMSGSPLSSVQGKSGPLWADRGGELRGADAYVQGQRACTGREDRQGVDLDLLDLPDICGELPDPEDDVDHRLAIRGREVPIAAQSAARPRRLEHPLGFVAGQRSESEGDVPQSLHLDAPGPGHHQRSELGIANGADDEFLRGREHRLHTDAVDARAGAGLADVAEELAEVAGQRRPCRDVQPHAADLRLVRDVR